MCSPEVTVTSFRPPCLCHLAVFSPSHKRSSFRLPFEPVCHGICYGDECTVFGFTSPVCVSSQLFNRAHIHTFVSSQESRQDAMAISLKIENGPNAPAIRSFLGVGQGVLHHMHGAQGLRGLTGMDRPLVWTPNFSALPPILDKQRAKTGPLSSLLPAPT